MTQGLREATKQDVTAELERLLLPRLVETLTSAGPGHCMRINDIDNDLMLRLCARLRAEVTNSEIVILADDRNKIIPPEYCVSSFKLIELRNPLPNGELRPPLLAFIPSDLRASAEDSFGVATFAEIDLSDSYALLRKQLLEDLPTSLKPIIMDCLQRLGAKGEPWPFADALAQVRFLVTAKLNNYDPEAIGAALFELGLVPDFNLLSQPESAPNRIVRNRECVSKLTWSAKSERGRVAELDLSNRGFRSQLGNYLADIGIEDPRIWTRRIVQDRNLWPLAFNRWDFVGADKKLDAICITDVTTDLPTVPDTETDDTLNQLSGQQVLMTGNKAPKKFSVRFRVSPHPSKIDGLARFSAQVISRDHGPVGLCRSKTVVNWKSSGLEASISFSSLNKIDWEEGWHLIRIIPETSDGDLIPLLNEAGEPLPWNSELAADRPNESDLFYVLPQGDIELHPAQKVVPREPSLIHALLRARFSQAAEGRSAPITTSSIRWSDRAARGNSGEGLEITLGSEGTVQIPVAHTLKVIEQNILAQPTGTMSWELPIALGAVGELRPVETDWPQTPGVQRFLRARVRYFEAIRNGPSELITQATNLTVLKQLVIEYADSYHKLLGDYLLASESATESRRVQVLKELRSLLGIDSVLIKIAGHSDNREAALLAPTHPIRALWLTTWAELGAQWAETAASAPREYLGTTRETVLNELVPANFPTALSVKTGKSFVNVDHIHPFWVLLAPTKEEDPRRLVGDVCSAIGLSEHGIGGATIDGAYLAERIERYLLQHPYIDTLTINAFNAGRAPILTEALLELQSRASFADLRYDVRLFVHDPDAQSVGEELTQLLSPSSNLNVKESDAFLIPAESHLRPKLGISIQPISDFRSNPKKSPAHISLLFDLFPPAELGAAPATIQDCYAPVYGLIQDFDCQYLEDSVSVAWHRRPTHGRALPLPGAEELSDVLSALSETMSAAAATVATSQAGLNLRPVITLALGADERALLHQVHDVSDWVFTVDRNIGVEFFDHGHSEGRPDYLIDHSPEFSTNGSHSLVITSRSLTELEALLKPTLKEYGLNKHDLNAHLVLDQLRSLSGRLALKLMSAGTQRAEALGLALARMFLQHQGAFENQVVIPLDAHLELYKTLKKNADDLEDEITLKRTDLALFDLNAHDRTLTCRLVEVKCYNRVGDVHEYAALKDRITQQIAQSEEVLSHHFDPRRKETDRVDRLLKTRELAVLLGFYLERGVRYGTMSADSADEGRFLLRTLERGYSLKFTRSALIFDFAKSGTDPVDMDNGIEFHRIGVDVIHELMNSCVEAVIRSDSESGSPPGPPDGGSPKPPPVSPDSSMPSLKTAAFNSTPRDRSVSWEELRSRQILGEDDVSEPGAVTPPEEQHEIVPTSGAPKQKPNSEPSTKSTKNQTPSMAFLTKDSVVSSSGQSSRPTDTHHQNDSIQQNDNNIGAPSAAYDILLGSTSIESPQYGILGEYAGRKIALDLNQTHTISLFGVQGGGKSYTLGTIAEMASLPIPNVNSLPNPLATVIFHYSPTMDYKPEFTSMMEANNDASQIEPLKQRYNAAPKCLEDLVLLVPESKLDERKCEYPGLEVLPLKFASSELQASHWRFLMGAVGNQATYIRQLNMIMRSLRDDLSLKALVNGVEESAMPDHLKELARIRLELAAQYITEEGRLSDVVRPGRLIIVDLRDEFIEKDEALGLFVVLLQVFADAKYNGNIFNKLVVFDEAHKYIESPDLVAGLVEVVREMRHKGTSIMVASQDPPSVPVSLIELSSQIIMHKFNSPAWLKHIQKANAALGALTPEKMSQLGPGEAYVWSSKASDEAFSRGAVKLKCRPRVTMHGGATKTAVKTNQ